jgi:hypothetical protein
VPTNITIVHTQDFIRATPDGALDLAASRKILTDLVSMIRTAGAHSVLIDTRGAESGRLSKSDLFQLGVAVGTQSALTRGRLALLVPLDNKADAEFFEAVARLEGANLRAFAEFESAINWLIMREQPQG